MTRALLVFACLSALACDQKAGSASAAADVAAPMPAPPMAEESARRQFGQSVAAQQPGAPIDRKVIETAQLRVESSNVLTASRTADSLTVAFGGTVTSATSTHGEHGYAETSMTLRLPTSRFREALAALRELGQVRVDNVSAEDVTRSYNDLEIRLAVKRDLVNRLRSLLTTRTAKLSDIIEVERELARAVSELEQMEGEQRYLDQQIAMSTVQATFFHAPLATPGNFVDPVREAVRNAIRVFGSSVATLISGLVFVTPWLILALIARRLLRPVWQRWTRNPPNPAPLA